MLAFHISGMANSAEADYNALLQEWSDVGLYDLYVPFCHKCLYIKF